MQNTQKCYCIFAAVAQSAILQYRRLRARILLRKNAHKCTHAKRVRCSFRAAARNAASRFARPAPRFTHLADKNLLNAEIVHAQARSDDRSMTIVRSSWDDHDQPRVHRAARPPLGVNPKEGIVTSDLRPLVTKRSLMIIRSLVTYSVCTRQLVCLCKRVASRTLGATGVDLYCSNHCSDSSAAHALLASSACPLPASFPLTQSTVVPVQTRVPAHFRCAGCLLVLCVHCLQAVHAQAFAL